MFEVQLRDPATGFDTDATAALREILTDPSMPVGTSLVGTSETEGRRIAALREAHDYLISRKLATSAHTVHAAATLIAELGGVDPALATTLRWHSVLVPVLAGLPPSRARNAVLGDVHRGDLLTWVPTVRSLTWRDGGTPGVARPIGRVDAEFEVDDFPGLFDSIVVWDSGTGALVVLPTHRERVSWEPSPDVLGRWLVRLSRATVHADELIPLDSDPRDLADWRA